MKENYQQTYIIALKTLNNEGRKKLSLKLITQIIEFKKSRFKIQDSFCNTFESNMSDIYNLSLDKYLQSTSNSHLFEQLGSLHDQLAMARKNEELQKKIAELEEENEKLKTTRAKRRDPEDYLKQKQAGSNDFLVSFVFNLYLILYE